MSAAQAAVLVGLVKLCHGNKQGEIGAGHGPRSPDEITSNRPRLPGKITSDGPRSPGRITSDGPRSPGPRSSKAEITAHRYILLADNLKFQRTL